MAVLTWIRRQRRLSKQWGSSSCTLAGSPALHPLVKEQNYSLDRSHPAPYQFFVSRPQSSMKSCVRERREDETTRRAGGWRLGVGRCCVGRCDLKSSARYTAHRAGCEVAWNLIQCHHIAPTFTFQITAPSNTSQHASGSTSNVQPESHLIAIPPHGSISSIGMGDHRPAGDEVAGPRSAL